MRIESKSNYLKHRSVCGVTIRREILPKYSMPYRISVHSMHTEMMSVLSERQKDREGARESNERHKKLRLNFIYLVIVLGSIMRTRTNIIVFPIVSQLWNPIKIIDIYDSSINQTVEYITSFNVHIDGGTMHGNDDNRPTDNETERQRAAARVILQKFYINRKSHCVKYSWPKCAKSQNPNYFHQKLINHVYYFANWIHPALASGGKEIIKQNWNT